MQKRDFLILGIAFAFAAAVAGSVFLGSALVSGS